MNAELVVRGATASDAECLAALGMQVWLQTYATVGLNPIIARYVLTRFTAEALARAITEPDTRWLAAEVNGHLVGYATLCLGAACPTLQRLKVELATLYIQQPFSGRGIGSALLREARQLARGSTGSAALWLTVNARNERAGRFYRRQGFVQMGDTYFELGDERHLNHVMVSEASATPTE